MKGSVVFLLPIVAMAVVLAMMIGVAAVTGENYFDLQNDLAIDIDKTPAGDAMPAAAPVVSDPGSRRFQLASDVVNMSENYTGKQEREVRRRPLGTRLLFFLPSLLNC